MCGRGKIEDRSYIRPELGDLVYVLEGIRTKTGIVVGVDGSIWHKHIGDWSYYILVEDGCIKKLRGWRVEKIQSGKNR